MSEVYCPVCLDRDAAGVHICDVGGIICLSCRVVYDPLGKLPPWPVTCPQGGRHDPVHALCGTERDAEIAAQIAEGKARAEAERDANGGEWPQYILNIAMFRGCAPEDAVEAEWSKFDDFWLSFMCDACLLAIDPAELEPPEPWAAARREAEAHEPAWDRVHSRADQRLAERLLALPPEQRLAEWRRLGRPAPEREHSGEDE